MTTERYTVGPGALELVLHFPDRYQAQTAVASANHSYQGKVGIDARFEGRKLRHQWFTGDMIELPRLARNDGPFESIIELEAWLRRAHKWAKDTPLKYYRTLS